MDNNKNPNNLEGEINSMKIIKIAKRAKRKIKTSLKQKNRLLKQKKRILKRKKKLLIAKGKQMM